MKKALSRMGIKKLSDQNKDLLSSLMMASSSLFIKVHNEGCPGRLIVIQVDDPTCKLCKSLMDILNPVDEKAKSFL